MSVQTNHEVENSKMRKFLPSHIPAMASSAIPKKRTYNSKKISKEDLALWMKNHPNEFLRDAAVRFGVSESKIVRLFRKYSMSARKPSYPRYYAKYPREALERYLLSHPDAKYKEIAKHFGGTSGAAKLAVNRHDLDHLKSPRGKWKKNEK